MFQATTMKIDFNVEDENIEFSKPISEQEILKFKEIYNVDLPASFIDFKKNIADYFYINSGNAFVLFSLFDNKESTSIAEISTDYAHLGNVLKTHKLIIFGMAGVDSETWAFYIDKKLSTGEYPIIWIYPGEERFFVHSTNFESFLNIQYHSLVNSGDYDDYDEYYRKLVSKYDQGIKPFGYNDIYSEAHDLVDLELIMNKL